MRERRRVPPPSVGYRRNHLEEVHTRLADGVPYRRHIGEIEMIEIG